MRFKGDKQIVDIMKISTFQIGEGRNITFLRVFDVSCEICAWEIKHMWISLPSVHRFLTSC